MKISGGKESVLQESIINQEFRIKFGRASLRLLTSTFLLIWTIFLWAVLANSLGSLSLQGQILIGLISLVTLYAALANTVVTQIVAITQSNGEYFLKVYSIFFAFKLAQKTILAKDIETIFLSSESEVIILSKTKLLADFYMRVDDAPVFIDAIANIRDFKFQELKTGSTVTIGLPTLNKASLVMLTPASSNMESTVYKAWNREGRNPQDGVLVPEGGPFSPQVSFSEGKEVEPENAIVKFFYKLWMVGLIALLIFLIYVAATMK
jgi:hypothetical protein